jgi:hypothetical protein
LLDRDAGVDALGAVDLGTAVDVPGTVVASPSGGCPTEIVTPSLAFHGVVGIDFDEDGIADGRGQLPSSGHADPRRP